MKISGQTKWRLWWQNSTPFREPPLPDSRNDGLFCLLWWCFPGAKAQPGHQGTAGQLYTGIHLLIVFLASRIMSYSYYFDIRKFHVHVRFVHPLTSTRCYGPVTIDQGGLLTQLGGLTVTG